MSRFRDWTNGRWPEIVSALLGDDAANTRKHHPCERVHGSTDCYRFSDRNGDGSYFCRCSGGEKSGFDLLECRLGVDFIGAVKAVESVIGPCPRDSQPKRESYGEVLLREGRPSKVSRYLQSRGLSPAPGLMFHRSVQYRDADGNVVGRYPAMLAPITRAGKFCAMHVTYLQGGKKAQVDPCRKILPGRRGTGGAVALWPAAERMGVAEGVETAIAASMIHGMPVWAALNTSMLGSFEPPTACRHLTIFGDHDANYAGHAAAYKLAHRLHGRVEIEIRFPDAVGDWNDVLLQREAAA